MISNTLERRCRYIHKVGVDVVQIDGVHTCVDGKLYYDTSGVVYYPDGRVVRQDLDVENELDLIEIPLVNETSIKPISNDCWSLSHVKTHNNGTVLTIHAILRHIPHSIQNGKITVSLGDPDDKTTKDPVLIPVVGRVVESGSGTNKSIVFNYAPKAPNTIGVLSLSATVVGEHIPSEYFRVLNDNLNFIVIDWEKCDEITADTLDDGWRAIIEAPKIHGYRCYVEERDGYRQHGFYSCEDPCGWTDERGGAIDPVRFKEVDSEKSSRWFLSDKKTV